MRRIESIDTKVNGVTFYNDDEKAEYRQNIIYELKEKGFWIAGTDAEGDHLYCDDIWSGPMAIVIGSEGEGMNKNIREKCDFLMSIPMAGSVNSLNAAVAAGIVVFEAVKQRRKDT